MKIKIYPGPRTAIDYNALRKKIFVNENLSGAENCHRL